MSSWMRVHVGDDDHPTLPMGFTVKQSDEAVSIRAALTEAVQAKSARASSDAAPVLFLTLPPDVDAVCVRHDDLVRTPHGFWRRVFAGSALGLSVTLRAPEDATSSAQWLVKLEWGDRRKRRVVYACGGRR